MKNTAKFSIIFSFFPLHHTNHKQAISKNYNFNNQLNKYNQKMFSESYESRMGMIRFSSNPIFFSQPQPEIIEPLEKRQKEPFEFSDIYNNPITAFQPFFSYVFGIKKDEINEQSNIKKNYQRQGINSGRKIKTEQNNKNLNGLYQLIETEDNFENKKKRVQQQFERYKLAMIENREKTFLSVHQIFGKIQYSLQKQPKILQLKFKQSLNNQIGSKIKEKISKIQTNFSIKKREYNIFEPYFKQSVLIQKQDAKRLPSFDNLSHIQAKDACFILINYLALPSSEQFFQQIEAYSIKTRKIFQSFINREQDNKKLLNQLPHKQSSFYWQKIKQCCRLVSRSLHYSDIDNHKNQSFQAQYIGMVTYDTLSKLKERQWIDSTITSSIIEYLKHIEGANNYHNNDNFRNYIFTHSETQIFMNSRKNLGENYTNYEKLIFLVNIQNSHWFVIVAYNNSYEIIIYDSMKQTRISEQYSLKIKTILQQQSNSHQSYKIKYRMSPYQTNTTDCGVFSIINMILAADNNSKSEKRNEFSVEIVSEIRQSLFLFLLYLGYCKKFNSIVRKDYFDILFRSTIKYNIISSFHKQKTEIKK